MAELSPPTFSRLARAVGFESYDALKDRCRSVLVGRKAGMAEKAQALTDSNDDAAPFISRHAVSTIEGIETLLSDLDYASLDEAARMLSDARRVVLVGAMRARAFVDYMSYLAEMSLDGWDVIGRGVVSLATETRDLGSDDVAIVLTMKPYAVSSVEIAQLVASRGAKLIVITDSQLSPLATVAARTFVVPAKNTQFFPSYVAATALIEALVGMVVKEKGAEAQRRIADNEQRSYELREYWRD